MGMGGNGNVESRSGTSLITISTLQHNSRQVRSKSILDVQQGSNWLQLQLCDMYTKSSTAQRPAEVPVTTTVPPFLS